MPDSAQELQGQTGTVIGWGVTETGNLANQLREAPMRVISNMECLDSNRDFYGYFLYDGNFCAGQPNQPTACTGDSGGGMYFRQSDSSWTVRGLVSLGVRSENGCDDQNFILFTDVLKHMSWITENLH